MAKKYVTSAHEIRDEYKAILLRAVHAKVKIEPSCDGVTRLSLFQKKKRPYDFFVQDGTLTVKPAKTKWYNRLRIGIDRSEITLSVPEALETVQVRSTVRCVNICSVSCEGEIDIQINTGNVSLENVSCKSLNSKGNTGSVSLNNVSAKESVSIRRNTGKVLLNGCSAPQIFVKTNTGRVQGKLMPNVAFTARSKTGKIELPKTPLGEAISGNCEITTITGSIKFE